MRYCTRCLYPENHPLNITFDAEGVCSGCRVHEEKDVLPWAERGKRLGQILESYRNQSGRNFDCVVPVSGGKDNHFIIHTIKKVYGMNPLVVTFNQEYNTKRGIRNLANLLTVFDCDQISLQLNPDFLKRLTRSSMRRFGSMYWHCLAGTQTFPVQIALRFRVPLVIWGVHGWSDQVGQFSHLDEVEMTKKVRKEHSLMGFDAEDMVSAEDGITRRDVQPFIYPYDNELSTVGVRGIYLSNYIRWDSKKQHELMIEKYGYETAKQERTFNTYEDVECLHSAGTHDYIKFLKYGYGKVTDHASREIRLKRMTREEGIELVREYSRKVPADLPIFLKWSGMTEGQFYDCVNRFRDPRAWKKKGSDWELIDPVENHIKDPGVDRVRLEKVEDCHFRITPSREPEAVEDEPILMGRSYLNKYNYKALTDAHKPLDPSLMGGLIS